MSGQACPPAMTRLERHTGLIGMTILMWLQTSITWGERNRAFHAVGTLIALRLLMNLSSLLVDQIMGGTSKENLMGYPKPELVFPPLLDGPNSF